MVSYNIDNSYVNLANILSNNKNKEEILKNSKISNEYKELCIESDILTGNTILLLRICVIVTFIIIISYSYKLMLKNKLDKLNFTTVIIILIFITQSFEYCCQGSNCHFSYISKGYLLNRKIVLLFYYLNCYINKYTLLTP